MPAIASLEDLKAAQEDLLDLQIMAPGTNFGTIKRE